MTLPNRETVLSGVGELGKYGAGSGRVTATSTAKHKKRPRVVAKSKLDRIKLAWKMLTKGWIYVRE